jgi:hypothetical protein
MLRTTSYAGSWGSSSLVITLIALSSVFACGGKEEPEFPDHAAVKEEAADEDWNTGDEVTNDYSQHTS